jgi:hypothetical protein
LVNKNINALSKIIVAKSNGKRTVAQIKEEMVKKYGTDDKEKLSDDQAKELAEALNAEASA